MCFGSDPCVYTIKHTDVEGYNERRMEGDSSKGENRTSGSLVYYRKYLEMDSHDDTVHTGVRLSRPANPDKQSVPGKVLFRVVCEAPCWATSSRRYEAPIQIGVGRAGPILYEAQPSPRSAKRLSQWTLRRMNSSMQTSGRLEDLEETVVSFLSPYRDIPFQVYTAQDTKIKMGALMLAEWRKEAATSRDSFFIPLFLSSPMSSLSTEYKDQEHEVAKFDAADGFGALHVDTRPFGTPFQSGQRDAIDIAYLIAIFETAHAMRDELASGGRGRRDEHGRLALAKRNTLAKAFSR